MEWNSAYGQYYSDYQGQCNFNSWDGNVSSYGASYNYDSNYNFCASNDYFPHPNYNYNEFSNAPYGSSCYNLNYALEYASYPQYNVNPSPHYELHEDSTSRMEEMLRIATLESIKRSNEIIEQTAKHAAFMAPLLAAMEQSCDQQDEKNVDVENVGDLVDVLSENYDYDVDIFEDELVEEQLLEEENIVDGEMVDEIVQVESTPSPPFVPFSHKVNLLPSAPLLFPPSIFLEPPLYDTFDEVNSPLLFTLPREHQEGDHEFHSSVDSSFYFSFDSCSTTSPPSSSFYFSFDFHSVLDSSNFLFEKMQVYRFKPPYQVLINVVAGAFDKLLRALSYFDVL